MDQVICVVIATIFFACILVGYAVRGIEGAGMVTAAGVAAGALYKTLGPRDDG